MNPTITAMAAAMRAEVVRQLSEGQGWYGGLDDDPIYVGEEEPNPRFGLDHIDGHIDLEKIARAGLDAAWMPASTLPSCPTDETWHILAYCPKSRSKVRELYRCQDYEAGPWNWQTPPGGAGRGNLVLVEAISHWQPLPEPPLVDAILEESA